MVSAIVKKSYRDLSKRKARTVLTILTIALGVAGISMFALVPLIDQAMANELVEANIHNVQLSVKDVELIEDNIQDIEGIQNVKSFEARTILFTKIYVGERRNDALLIGVEDFSNQNVDVVIKNSGQNPGNLEVLTEAANVRTGVFDDAKGKSIRVLAADGSEVDMGITGEAHCLLYSTYPNQGIAVFYTNVETVQALGNFSGYNILSFKLEDKSQEATEEFIEDIRSYLTNNMSVVTFANLPDIREEGTWPGQEFFSNITTMFYLITLVAIFCSIFLISNTMNTIVSEQKKQIAGMKAIGATRFQVFKSYLTTSFLMGVIGAFFGAIFGIIIAVLFINNMGGILGISPGFMVHIPTVGISILVGILVTILASIPALIGALRITVREGMQDQGISAEFGTGVGGKLLQKTTWMPRTVQMGVRSIGRNKKRSIFTMIQVAIAVSVLLGIMGFATTMFTVAEGEYDNWAYNIQMEGRENGGKPIPMDMADTLENITGVDIAEPYISSGVMVGDDEYFAIGMLHDTSAFNYQRTTVKGNWFTAEQEDSKARVVVITEVITRSKGWEPGDSVTFYTAAGPETFEVVGVSSILMYDGHACLFPLKTLQDVLQKNDTVSGFYILTDSKDHEDIDQVSTLVEDEMTGQGYTIQNSILYVTKELKAQGRETLRNTLYAIGSLVIVITLIGLMNTMTMNIIDRTKEIGIFRCIGASAKNIRNVFASEGIVLVIIGWALGIPVGYAIGRLIWDMMSQAMGIEASFLYPALNVPIVLMITLFVGLLVIQPQLWRATHIKPGNALRYQ